MNSRVKDFSGIKFACCVFLTFSNLLAAAENGSTDPRVAADPAVQAAKAQYLAATMGHKAVIADLEIQKREMDICDKQADMMQFGSHAKVLKRQECVNQTVRFRLTVDKLGDIEKNIAHSYERWADANNRAVIRYRSIAPVGTTVGSTLAQTQAPAPKPSASAKPDNSKSKDAKTYVDSEGKPCVSISKDPGTEQKMGTQGPFVRYGYKFKNSCQDSFSLTVVTANWVSKESINPNSTRDWFCTDKHPANMDCGGLVKVDFN